MNEIGIRQGRLSPSSTGPVQHFPQASWKDEFMRAGECGFAFIEWLLSASECERNPIWSDGGQADIRTAVSATGVAVRSLCADYFMVHPFVRVSDAERLSSERVLNHLIIESSRAGIRIVVLPLIEAAEMRDSRDMNVVRESLDEALELASALSVTLAMETDLPAGQLMSFLNLRPHHALGVCYDTGNAAVRGFDAAADLSLLGPHVSLVHVKDRDRQGTNVELGSGIADLAGAFRLAARENYSSPFVLETPRGDDPIEAARTNLEFVNTRLTSIADACSGSRTD
jgi:L-ribulose-5-phosphate 3-epimerase